MGKDVDGLDHTTDGTLYQSITHMHKQMASASFGCVGHARPALWSRGCYCKHKWTEASICYAKHTDFLHFYDAVHVPPLPCRLSVRHIGCCTHEAGTHFLESDSRPLLRPCACSVVPSPQTRPHAGKVHTFKLWGAQTVVTVRISRDAMLFFKSTWELSLKALFDCISSIGLGAQKVNNQF